VWREAAAGLLAAERAGDLLSHASGCDYCGRLLLEAAEDFNSDLTAEETQRIAGLSSAQPAEQRRIAARLAEACGQATTAKPRPARWQWMMAAAASLVVGAAGLWLILQRADAPGRLLAQAYSERRTLEFRIAGAQNGPVRVERGRRTTLPAPAALREAQALILRQLAKNPDAAEWLELKARSDLLDMDYPAALQSATRALDSRPGWPPALIDLAAAHFQRAEAEVSPSDYGAAAEKLSLALRTNADDPVALFNRAMTYERLSMYREALRDWDHYLRVDGSGEWAREARERRAAVQRILDRRGQRQQQSPAGAGARADSAAGVETNQAEALLDRALTQWLPALFGGVVDPEVRRSLAAVGEFLETRWDDPWLNDVLKGSSGQQAAAGFNALAKAIQANGSGDPGVGRELSAQAEQSLRNAGHAAGALRAAVERVYALHRSGESRQCAEEAAKLAPAARQRHYRWAEVQLGLEWGICLSAFGRNGEAVATVDSAVNKTGPAFPVLRLRGIGIAAAIQTSIRNSKAAWTLDFEGLRLYWSGSYPPIRAHQFYTDLSRIAENAGDENIALALAREAAVEAADSGNPLALATSRFRVGKLASAAGSAAEAERELTATIELFDRLPKGDATEFYRTDCRVGLAGLAVRAGRLTEAGQWLAQARDRLPTLRSFPIIARYFETLSQLSLQSGRIEAAEQAARSRVAVAELALESLRDDRQRAAWKHDMANAYSQLAGFRLTQRRNPSAALELVAAYRDATAQPATADAAVLDFGRLETNPPPPRTLDAEELKAVARNNPHVVYAVFPDSIAVWTVVNGQIYFDRVPVVRERLRQLSRVFRMDCANPQSDMARIRAVGRQLHDLLIGPVASHLPSGATLFVDLDPELADLPLQALLQPDGTYFGSHSLMVISAGFASERQLRAVAGISASAAALVVGAPALAPGTATTLPPLPGAIEEARNVASHFERASLLTGKEAVESTIRRELPAAFVFHFAGHSTESGGHAGLLLAPEAASQANGNDSVMDAGSITPELLGRCTLAVFSACATGAAGTGGAPNGLVQVFLRAGVPQVVASRWNVDSASTADFMQAFYERLVKGSPAGESLEWAAGLIRSRAGTSHPYYWAAFQLYGKT
jgi:CHAT domain-containing protein